MIDEITLRRFIAELVRLTNYPDTLVEKDIMQKLVLNQLYSDSNAKEKLIFKGGTCITRTLLDYYRFSEDLDFAWTKKQNRNYYYIFEKTHLKPLANIGVEIGQHFGTQGGKLMKWDLICGAKKLVMSVNFAQEIVFDIQNRTLQTLKVPESEEKKLLALHPLVAPNYFLKMKIACYSPKEIACEKLVAILTRKDLTKPRDIVDLFYMQETIDLIKLIEDNKSMNKIKRQINSAPIYASTFAQRKDNILEYLKYLAQETEHEQALYIKPVKREDLDIFSQKVLAPVFLKLVKEI
jgi:predicted nucleotidyltransferase component of viral defense system